MKKLSPPSTDRFSPAIMPPCALVSISTPPDMLVIAPASALTSPPGGDRDHGERERRAEPDVDIHGGHLLIG